MKRTLVISTLAFAILASAMQIYADIARPKPSPAKEGKVVFHTGLTVAPDANVSEARLQISQETLNNIRAAANDSSVNLSLTRRITYSSGRTIMAGLFLFLSLSFAGVWLARAGQRSSHKAAAAVLFGMAMLGAAAIIVRANAGPPGYYRWRNLPENLGKGEPTQGGLDIEIVPGDGGMKLIVPLKNTKKPGEE